MTPDLTLLACTRNRASDLAEMLDSALAQDTEGFRLDVLVVDNGSTDATHAVVATRKGRGPHPIRYVLEPRPGKGYALETGLRLIEAPLYAIVDDDLLLSPGYAKTLWQAFKAHPDIACIGGRVAPRWQNATPTWLGERHFGALALTTYGDAPITCSSDHPLTILAGAFRTEAVRQVGGYRQDLAVGAGGIGGTEDTDLLERMYTAGMRALYWPAATIFHKVEPERLTKRYHRRWHRGHGRFYARMRSPDLEASRWRLLGVPGHLLRRTAAEAGQWVRALLAGDRDQAFAHEVSLQFTAGFLACRWGLRP